jgi:hypothetical protein
MINEIEIYNSLLINIKNRVRQGQLKANLAANAQLLATYWDIGRMIYLQQQKKGWGKGVIPKLAADLKNELSEAKGFSERNLRYMVYFYSEYSFLTIWQLPVAKFESDTIMQPSVAQLHDNPIVKLPVSQLESPEQQLITKIGWAHHIILIPESLKSSLPTIEEIEKELMNTNDKDIAE